MDIRKVKKLIELLEESNVSEIEINENEESVRISRNATSNSHQSIPTQQFFVPPPAATNHNTSFSTESQEFAAAVKEKI